MRRLIFILLVLVLSVWIGSEIAKNPGYALFVYKQWIIQMPLWFAAASALSVFLLMYSLLRLIAYLTNAGSRWRAWWFSHRRNKAYDKTHKGLLEMIEERWASAERHLLEGIDPVKNPVINYLAAAEAAYAQKAYERCDGYLRKAYEVAPQDEVVIGLVQAKLQLEQGQLEQVLATLTRLRLLAPYSPAVLRLLEKMYIRLSDWQHLLELLPYLRKAKVIDAAQALIFEKNIYCQMLDQAERKNRSIHAVRELWNIIPKKIRLNADVLERYAKLLKGDKNSAEEIEPLIRKILQKEWNEELVLIYGALADTDPKSQLSVAESWINQYGKRPPLLLTLGRLSLRCQLWGKARTYLEEGLKQEPNSEAQFELAKLFEHLGETQLALRHYKDGLELATVT